MKKLVSILFVALFIMTTTVINIHAAGPSEERIRSAYKMLLSETDANKDGNLAISECQVIYKDPAMAEKNCQFWDADKDGFIRENEYVSQVMSIGKKK